MNAQTLFKSFQGGCIKAVRAVFEKNSNNNYTDMCINSTWW